MERMDQNTLETRKTANQETNSAGSNPTSAKQELSNAQLEQIVGGGLDDIPTVDEHPYDPDDNPRY